jgi:hypothetical protein
MRMWSIIVALALTTSARSQVLLVPLAPPAPAPAVQYYIPAHADARRLVQIERYYFLAGQPGSPSREAGYRGSSTGTAFPTTGRVIIREYYYPSNGSELLPAPASQRQAKPLKAPPKEEPAVQDQAPAQKRADSSAEKPNATDKPAKDFATPVDSARKNDPPIKDDKKE